MQCRDGIKQNRSWLVVAYTERLLILITLKGSQNSYFPFSSPFIRCFSSFCLFCIKNASGRCLIAVGNSRLAEKFLQMSMKLMAHPDTILLLGKIFLPLLISQKAVLWC